MNHRNQKVYISLPPLCFMQKTAILGCFCYTDAGTYTKAAVAVKNY